MTIKGLINLEHSIIKPLKFLDYFGAWLEIIAGFKLVVLAQVMLVLTLLSSMYLSMYLSMYPSNWHFTEYLCFMIEIL